MPRPRIDRTLRFCRARARELDTEPDALRWLIIGLALALQEACVLALTGYDTADPDDILTPGRTELAPIETLLRRVCSERYLAPPEKLGVGNAKVEAALKLYRARNQMMHAKPGDPTPVPEDFKAPVAATLEVIRWLAITYPAFDNADLSRACREALNEMTELST